MATGDQILSAGSQTTVITGSGTLADGAYSTSGDATAITGNLYPFAEAVLTTAFSVAPTAGKRVHLFRRGRNIDGTNHAPVPVSGYEEIYVGSFTVSNTASSTSYDLPEIPLRKGDQDFFIKNDTGQTMSSGFTVKITPLTFNVA